MTVDQALLSPLVPQVLGRLVRRYGDFDACEDAVQEALLAATVQWAREGVPDNPLRWLVTVAARRLTDHYRSQQARVRRETLAAALVPHQYSGPDAELISEQDDTLILLFMCCHSSLSPLSQAALTLRAVGGLTTAEIARGFLTTEPTMKQRISRAKQRIKASGIPFFVLLVVHGRFSQGDRDRDADGDTTGEEILFACSWSRTAAAAVWRSTQYRAGELGH
jgi:RNA polymerase sigma factor (sigma-70 family)